MAKDWNKLGEKLGAQTEGPSPADWAAMEQKIANQPALQAKPGFSLALKAALIFLGSLSVIAVLWFYNASNQDGALLPQTKESNTEAPRLNSPNTTSDANGQNLQSKGMEEAPTNSNSEGQISEEAVFVDSPEESQVTIKPSSPASNNTSTSDENSDPNKSAVAAKSIANSTNTASASAYEQKTKKAIARIEQEQEQEGISTVMEEEAKIMAPNEAANLELVDKENTQEGGLVKAEQDLSLKPQEAPANEESLQSEEKTTLPVNEPSPAIAAADTLAQDEVEVPKISAPKPEEEDFINPATGFKLQSVNLALGAATNFGNPLGFGLQTAIDFQWNRDNWFFQGGLSLSQDQQQLHYNVIENQLLIDSTWALDISSRQVVVITRIWVIDSINAGHYEVDTAFQTIIDTNIVLNVDTNDYQVSFPRTKQIRFQYAELPILYGYQKQLGAWNISLAAGLSVQQALAINEENYSRSESFGLAILLQPAISYRINQQWSVFTRLRLQEQVLENRLFQTNQSPYSCQLGVSYHW